MSTVATRIHTNPYPGLIGFDEPDAPRFFGRDSEIEEVLNRMATHRFLAVVGVSGCGKSSLIRAGVIPVLKMGMASNLPAHWRICIMSPGANPLHSMRAALKAPEGWPASSFDLTEHVRSILSSGETLLLIVDQFEELFRFRDETLPQDGGNSAALFVNVLLNAVGQREVPIYVLLTMRTDFLGRCSQFRGLPEALNDCYYMVPRLTRLQQEQAIVRPLEDQDDSIHPALVQRLLNDSAEDPDHLPVLQHLLRRLWENWDKRKKKPDEPISDTDYQNVGGWANALNQDAESVMTDFKGDREAISRLFQWITDRGTGQQPVRRPRRFSECARISGLSPAQLKKIVAAFQKRGLLRPFDLSEDPLVDLPHESVMWQWMALKRWIVKEAEWAAQGRFILDSARQQNLLRGLALTLASSWRGDLKTQRDSALRYLNAVDLETAESWILKSEQHENRRQWRHKWTIRGTGILVPVLLVVAVWMLQEHRKGELAQQSSEFAKQRELFAWSALSLGDDPERSLILGLFSWGKRRQMITGLEEELHTAVLQSSVRLTLLNAHNKEAVAGISWSPDGTSLATAGADSTAKVWEGATGKLVRTFTGHQERVNSVAWSPDSSKLATASSDKTAKIWDASSGRLLLTLIGHTDGVNSVTWSPDGSKLATASSDKTAKVWDASSGRLLLTLIGHMDAVNSISWSGDGTKVGTASNDQTMRIWDAYTGHKLGAVNVLSRIACIAWSPDGTKVAVGIDSSVPTAKIWSASDSLSKPPQVLHGHQLSPTSIGWSPDSSKLVTGSYDHTAKVWDVVSGGELQTLRHDGAVTSVAWAPDGNMVATASDDGTAKTWEVGPGRELLTLDQHQAPVTGIAWSADSSKIATASWDGTGKLWDARTGKRLLTLGGVPGAFNAVACSPNGTQLAFANYDTTATVWDANTGKKLLTLSGHQGVVASVVWSPDGTKLATASADTFAKIWDASTGQEQLALSGHKGAVNAIAWSPDGTKLATASSDQTAKIWDATTGKGLQTLYAHQGWVMGVAWAPDSNKLATVSYDQTAKVWEAATGKEIMSLRGHQSAVTSVSWSKDGKLATGSWDKTVRVWDANTGQEVMTLHGHRDTVYGVAWSPDGNRLASAGADKIGQIYVVHLDELLRLVRSRITRKLKSDECHRYLGTDTCPPLPDVP